MPRWQNTAIWSGAVVIIIIIFRQALPIQLQNTCASPRQGRAGLAFEKLLCPSAGTDEQNIIETEQKQATTNKWRLHVGSLQGMAWGQAWAQSRSAIASTEGYFRAPFFWGGGASPAAPPFLVHGACW